MRRNRRTDEAIRRIHAREPLVNIAMPYDEVLAQLDRGRARTPRTHRWER
jgi:hypothetical protein